MRKQIWKSLINWLNVPMDPEFQYPRHDIHSHLDCFGIPSEGVKRDSFFFSGRLTSLVVQSSEECLYSGGGTWPRPTTDQRELYLAPLGALAFQRPKEAICDSSAS